MHEWEDVYSSGNQINLWPYTEILTRYRTHQNKIKAGGVLNILELGCGVGNNSKLFAGEGFSYFGVDFSETAIAFAKEKYESDLVRFAVENLELIEFDNDSYDLIFDRAAVTHLESAKIKTLISKVSKALNSGGIYLGIDWFSTKHPEYQNSGSTAIDLYDRTGFQTGKFRDIGTVHFSDRLWITEAFRELEILELIEGLSYDRLMESESIKAATWSVVARKGMG